MGVLLKAGDIVIYESAVYPGAAEEICIPIRSTELATIKKVTSGSTPEVANFIDALYRSIIPAGTHKAGSIRVAEATKVIENTQRDVNIALINELALIFDRLGIDTQEVLEAAGSKWNFLSFRPGLVGGHCIGVDPYYLTTSIEDPQPWRYDAIVLAVAHRQFGEMGIERLQALGRPGAIFFDVKHLFPTTVVDGRL